MRTAAIGIAQTQPGHRLRRSTASGGSPCASLMPRCNAAGASHVTGVAATRPSIFAAWRRRIRPLRVDAQQHPMSAQRDSFHSGSSDSRPMRADHVHAADGVAGTLRVIAIIGAAALLVWALADVVLLVFMAALLAIILRGISGWLAERTGAP